MGGSATLRHSMVERAVRRLPGVPAHNADAYPAHAHAMVLWASLSKGLSDIIGERGFASLYGRSLHVTAKQYAWLKPHAPTGSADSFTLLAAALAQRAPQEAHGASAALLNTFIDTLIVLIGELLTNTLLRTAWGDDVVHHAGTEARP